MGRKKKKSGNVVKLGDYNTPKDEYMYSPVKISIVALSKKWKGVKKGYTFPSLIRKSQDEGWPRLRKNYQIVLKKEVEKKITAKLSERMSSGVVDANFRHIKLGQLMQDFGSSMIKYDNDRKCFYIQDPKSGEIIIPKNLGEIVRFIKEGAILERKALGLADQIVKIQFARELGEMYFEIVGKYITEVSVLKNISGEIENVIAREEESLEQLKTHVE